MTKETFCALVALLLIALANLCEAQRVPQKKVNGACTYDPTDRALTLEFYADFNGDAVNKVLAINGRVYDRANNNEASPACLYTFRDGSSEKILIRSTLYTDGSQTDVNLCGGRRTNANSANSFEWTISLREHFAEKIYTEMDRRYLIICIIADAQSPYVTTNFQVFGADEEEDAMRVRPSNEMSVLEQVGGNYLLDDATVNIGQNIKFRIQSNLHESYLNHLFHYGIMAFNCIRSASASFQNPTTFIGSNGCQAVTDPFGLTRGFTKADVLVEPGGYFRLETEAFIFAPSRPSRKRYFIACYVAYCYGVYDANNPANNDGRCENLCEYNSNAKRRRRSESLSDNDRVILAVDVDTSSPVDNKSNDPEKSQQTTLIAVTTVIGALILGIIIIIAVLLLVARRRRYKEDDTSSQSSSNDLPIHTVMKT